MSDKFAVYSVTKADYRHTYVPFLLVEFWFVACFLVCNINFSIFVFDTIQSVQKLKKWMKTKDTKSVLPLSLKCARLLTVPTGCPGRVFLQHPVRFSLGWHLPRWLRPCHLCFLSPFCQAWSLCPWPCHCCLWLQVEGNGTPRGLNGHSDPSPAGY